MLKKTITFEDLDGKPITEDFYFHLTKAEVAEMEMGKKGGLTEYLKKIIAEEDGEKLVAIFKDLLTKTVGRRSPDGRRFIKNQEIIDDFVQTDAYSELFIELATNAGQAAAFINGVVPASMQDAIKQSQAGNVELPAGDDSAQSTEPSWVTEGRTPTPDELKNATTDQIQLAFLRKQSSPEIAPPVA